MAMKFLCAFVLCLSLAACSEPTEQQNEISSADQAKAAALADSYESARSGKNWEAAEALADQLREKYPDAAATAKIGPSLPQVREQAEQARESRRLSGLWDYQANKVEKGVQRSASIYSKTPPAEEGEVPPTADAQLVLRDHPSWGRSAYLLLAQSHFDCGKPCTMQISFDGAQATAFAGRQADSGKGPALFINDDKKFIEAMTLAKKVKIDLPKGSGRIPTLVFEVAGYDPARFEKP
jgi:hypothetical protein